MLTGIIIGMFVGVALGVLIMSLMAMAKRTDRRSGEYKQPYDPVYYDSWAAAHFIDSDSSHWRLRDAE